MFMHSHIAYSQESVYWWFECTFMNILLAQDSTCINFTLLVVFIATEPKDADIIWTSMQIDEETKKAAGLNDEQYINQFPFEACLVMKHHLAETIQKVIIDFMCLYSVVEHLFFMQNADAKFSPLS